MADVFQLEWLNQNSLRNYPIVENAQRRPHTTEGEFLTEFTLPNYVVVDFVMTVGSDMSTDVYIDKLAVVGDSVTFVIGSQSGVAANIYVDVSKHTKNKAYSFYGINEYAGSRGCIVVGDLSRLGNDLPDGVYTFDYAETAFEKRCVRPSAGGVSSLSIVNSSTGYSSKKLRGDVKLVAGYNVAFRYDEEHNAIWISADSNSGYNDKCECGDSTTVKSINGISVDNVTIVGDDCVSVTTTGKTIKISDKCSKPCCGCAEIDFINEKIAQINTAVNRIDNYSNVLNNRITELQSAYVQSEDGTDKS